MPEPEVFNWIPREGMETTRKPSVITVKFGDGYERLNRYFVSQMNIPVPRWTVFYPVMPGFVLFCGVRQNTTGLSGLSAGSGAFRIMPCIPILTVPLKRSLTDAGYTAGNTQ